MYGVKDDKKGYIPHGNVYGVYNKTYDRVNQRWITDVGNVEIGLDKINRNPHHQTRLSP